MPLLSEIIGRQRSQKHKQEQTPRGRRRQGSGIPLGSHSINDVPDGYQQWGLSLFLLFSAGKTRTVKKDVTAGHHQQPQPQSIIHRTQGVHVKFWRRTINPEVSKTADDAQRCRGDQEKHKRLVN